MLGRSVAAAYPPLRRAILRVWGVPDVSTRQKWHSVWPQLAALPPTDFTVLDAGCGSGIWTLELAARRPGWRVLGLDRDGDALERAESMRLQLRLGNARFVQADFLSFRPAETYDLVLSVSSAHYLAADGSARRLFDQFRAWLSPRGILVLLGPRRRRDVPFVALLPRPEWHGVFSSDELASLSRASGLRVRTLRPDIGRSGTMAKQLAASPLGRLTYPAQAVLDAFDRMFTRGREDASLMWLLVAGRDE